MIIDYSNRLFEGVLFGCMTRASSWCDCPTAPPASLEKPRLFSMYKLKRKELIVKGNTIVFGDRRYSAVSYGFVHLYTSHPTHIPLIPSVTS